MLVIFVSALAIRGINILLLPLDAETMLWGDAPMYWNGAQAMIQFGGFTNAHGQPITERVPFYFYFLKFHRHLFGADFASALLLQAVVDSITCLLIARLAELVTPSLRLPAGLLAAAWPNLWIHSGQLLTDTLFLFFFTGALLCLLHFVQSGGWRFVLLSGLALGAATMTRPVSQFLLLALIPTIPVWTWLRQKSLRRAVLYGAVFVVAAALPLLPYMVRNLTQFGTLALTSQNGNHLLNWVVPEVEVLAKGTSRPEVLKEGERRAREQAELLGVASDGKMSPFLASYIYQRAALAVLRETQPKYIAQAWLQGALINMAAPALLVDIRVQRLPHGSFLDATSGSLLERLIAFLRLSSPLYLAVLIIGFGGVVVAGLLQLAGLFIHLRRQTLVAVLGIGTVLYFLLLNGPIASPKYRLPIEPILITWTAVALKALWDRVRGVAGRANAPPPRRGA